MPGTPAVIRSTADLTPDGILGYAKAIAASIGAALTALAQLIPEDWPYKVWLQGVILICTAIAVYAVPNKVTPVQAAPTVVTGVVPPPGPIV